MSNEARQFVPQQGRPPKPDINGHSADRRKFAEHRADLRAAQCNDRPTTDNKES